MTGKGEVPEWRPLTLCGWPGEGVSAGDEGRLLYAQRPGWLAAGQKRTKHKHFHSKKQKTKNADKKKATAAIWLFPEVILSFKLLL